jgi:hypothetical protein
MNNMNITDTIIDNVVRGLVLDSKGNWIPIAQMKAIECNVLQHLKAGEVLWNGKWVALQKCKEMKSQGPIQESPSDALSRDADHISNKKPIPWIVVSCHSGEQQLAPESLIPLISQAASAEKDSKS